ncbi:hypothetical protein CHS0354_023307 [Potamilus streckersoni]|uniref:Uncharacterized protein n=1 Tax=Potamilus streckersoni TaxID=2493646 RepID=A0AAE0T4Z6_9BIVA|nr:hypothetical protein CHS0354_023307 [Potamilus streckersoni]
MLSQVLSALRLETLTRPDKIPQTTFLICIPYIIYFSPYHTLIHLLDNTVLITVTILTIHWQTFAGLGGAVTITVNQMQELSNDLASHAYVLIDTLNQTFVNEFPHVLGVLNVGGQMLTAAATNLANTQSQQPVKGIVTLYKYSKQSTEESSTVTQYKYSKQSTEESYILKLQVYKN